MVSAERDPQKRLEGRVERGVRIMRKVAGKRIDFSQKKTSQSKKEETSKNSKIYLRTGPRPPYGFLRRKKEDREGRDHDSKNGACSSRY